jgi:hypothetical protein
MSDNYAEKRYRRQVMTPVGTTGRKKKFLLLAAILIIAGLAGIGYLGYSSGIFTDDPEIVSQLLTRINLERAAANLQPVQLDSSLSNLATVKSNEVKLSQLNYAGGANPALGDGVNVIVIPKISWALSGKDFVQQVTGTEENGNSAILKSIHNPKNSAVGIGVTSDNYNYFIVTKWG